MNYPGFPDSSVIRENRIGEGKVTGEHLTHTAYIPPASANANASWHAGGCA